MMYLGDYPTSATVRFMWNSNAVAGESITRSTNGSIRIYKNNSTTERSSSAGITDTEDFDSLTGVHHCNIDLSDNTDAGFYAAGNEYQVVLQGATIDSKSINAVLAHFSIERSGGILALLKSVISGSGVNVTQFGGSNLTAASGRPEVNVSHIAGSAVSTSSAQLGVNVVNWKGSAAPAMTGDAYARLGAPAGASVSADIATVAGYVDTEVAAIKAKTDQLTFTAANKVDATIQAAGDFAQGAADKVWSTAARTLTAFGFSVTVGTNNDKTGYSLSSAGIQAIWDALTSALTTAGSIGKLIVDNLNATISGIPAAIGSRTPAALTGKPTTYDGFLYFLRQAFLNKLDYDKATDHMKLYEDDGTTVKLDHTMTDDASNATRGAA